MMTCNKCDGEVIIKDKKLFCPKCSIKVDDTEFMYIYMVKDKYGEEGVLGLNKIGSKDSYPILSNKREELENLKDKVKQYLKENNCIGLEASIVKFRRC